MAIVWKEIGGELKLLHNIYGRSLSNYPIRKKCIVVVSSNKEFSISRRGAGQFTEIGSLTNGINGSTPTLYEEVYLVEPEESITLSCASQGEPLVAVITV